jgi:putative transposase
MGYSKGCHTTFHHRYHIVWAPKYRYKVLIGDVRLRVREIEVAWQNWTVG